MQDRRNLLLGASRRRVEQVGSERDKDAERLLDDGREDLGFLAESKPAAGPSISEQPGPKAREGKERKRRGAPERADHLENDDDARADLADVVARKEGLGVVKQLRPSLREVIRDERLERARELDCDHARRGCGKEREDIALQGRAVGRQDRFEIGPYTRGFCAIRRCDAIFDPDGNGLARRALSM